MGGGGQEQEADAGTGLRQMHGGRGVLVQPIPQGGGGGQEHSANGLTGAPHCVGRPGIAGKQTVPAGQQVELSLQQTPLT